MHLMASHGAAVHWRSLLENDASAAKGIMMWRLRRTIGMAIHKARPSLPGDFPALFEPKTVI